MKKQWMAVLPVFFSALMLQAQPEGKTVEEKAQNVTERMTDELDLTEEQTANVLEINHAHIAEMEEMRTQKERQRKQVRAIMQQHEADMKAVLTDEQFERFKEMRKERLKKMRKRRGQEHRLDRDME